MSYTGPLEVNIKNWALFYDKSRPCVKCNVFTTAKHNDIHEFMNNYKNKITK